MRNIRVWKSYSYRRTLPNQPERLLTYAQERYPMDNLIQVYNHFARIPLDHVPHVMLRMLPGILIGLGLSLCVLFMRDTSHGFFKKYLENVTRRYNKPAKWVFRGIESVGTWFIWISGIYTAIQIMPFMEPIDRPAQKFYTFLIFVQLGLLATHLISEWAQDFTNQHRKTDAARVTMVSSLVRVGYIVIWALVATLLLHNYGVDVSAMVAGLGVGGLAVAFAFQNILKDIFGSFSIVFDKPFVIGDFISAGDFSGTVEQIGTKTTRLRSLSGELIVISNNDILSTRIRNYGNMYERRVVFNIKIQYGTPADKVEKIPQIIKDLLTKYDDIRFDRSHFQTFTDFGLVYETVYIVLIPDFNRMMDIQQEVNLAIYKRFEKEGIRFAVPIQNMQSSIETFEEAQAIVPTRGASKIAAKKPARR